MLSEVIDWYLKRNKKLKIFKVDFEKAFNSVSWKYIDFIIQTHGFGLNAEDGFMRAYIRLGHPFLLRVAPHMNFLYIVD